MISAFSRRFKWYMYAYLIADKFWHSATAAVMWRFCATTTRVMTKPDFHDFVNEPYHSCCLLYRGPWNKGPHLLRCVLVRIGTGMRLHRTSEICIGPTSLWTLVWTLPQRTTWNQWTAHLRWYSAGTKRTRFGCLKLWLLALFRCVCSPLACVVRLGLTTFGWGTLFKVYLSQVILIVLVYF